MIRLLLDQGLPRSTVELLSTDGWDVIHVSQRGLSTVTDTQILEYARTDNRVICTLDADYHALLAVSNAAGPSVIRIRQQGLRGPDIAHLLRRIWQDVKDPIASGAAITVTERTVRVRRLPIGATPDQARGN